MMIYHDLKGTMIAELPQGSQVISDAGVMLDLMAEAGYNGSSGLLIYHGSLPGEFFDLKTKLAGEILQKFSNYRMRLAIVGDFSGYKSKSLADFIRESNKGKTIFFASTAAEALIRLGNQ